MRSARGAVASRAIFRLDLMPYALRPGLFWCEIASHILFLDLPGDRYFCLSGTAAGAFLAAAQGNIMEDVQARAAEQLIRLDIIRVSDRPDIPPACYVRAPVRAWLAESSSAGDLLAVTWRFFALRIALMRTGLQSAVIDLARRKSQSAPQSPACNTVGAVVAAARRLSWFRSSRDQCLPRALAIAHLLAARGVAADLVIGVSLHPFRAHAWVQVDDAVICDDVDTVRLYAPILVV